uniref:Putative pectin lyase (Parallel beta-helix repeat protein) n=1 Tax=Polynucleobacter necessarius subsp. necessarius (strain STIR1) TaxID=452638 RepID=B1XVD0_POLNS
MSGNGANGLHVSNSNAVLIQANFFGAGANNASVVPNGIHGILVDGSSAGVQVGGVIPLGNVSAGNTKDGIRVGGTVSGFTTFNTFGGLFAFQGAAPNGENGIAINATGGNNLIRTNEFSGNRDNGIKIFGAATGVAVDPNVVGLNTEGTGVLANPPVMGYGNGGSGVLITDTASGNFIGGYYNSVIPQNTFSGNACYDVEITSGANNNFVFNSVIGLATTQVAGTGFGNGLGGILIDGGYNFVGVFTAPSTYSGTSAIISANQGDGVKVSATGGNNTVTNNYFGYAKKTIAGPLLPAEAPNTGLPIVNLGGGTNTVTPNN